MGDRIFSDQEYKALLYSFALGQGAFTEAQAALVIDWCQRARFEADLLELVQEGELLPCLKGDKVAFRKPTPEEKGRLREYHDAGG